MRLSRNATGLIAWLGATFVAAALGAIASRQAVVFYGQLTQPAWAPPAWLFGPVWSVLYALMGVSAWLIWKPGGFAGARWALGLFIAQLIANALWSWLFFAWHLGAAASAEIVLLWGLILATVVAFGRKRGVAAALLLPYLAWVTFATALCFAVWRLNVGRL